MKYVILHNIEDGSTVIVNLGTVRYLYRNSSGTSLIFSEAHTLMVSETPAEIRALAA